MLADMACSRIIAGINRRFIGERPIKAVLDPYNPTGSTMQVNFNTSRKLLRETDARRCHINWVVLVLPRGGSSFSRPLLRQEPHPTAEYQSVLQKTEQSPVRVVHERRNRDLDPQLVWRGKDEQDWSDLVVHAPPLYIQEKILPKVLIDDLLARCCWLYARKMRWCANKGCEPSDGLVQSSHRKSPSFFLVTSF
jgi:hypothetical protein